MKKIFISFACLAVSGLAFSQTPTQKIVLGSNQKVIVETTTDVQATLVAGMELTGNTATVNELAIKNAAATNYTISNTMTKVKMDMNMMGQPTSYDSENKSANSEDMAKAFDDVLNKPVDVVVDNATGRIIPGKKKEKAADADADANPMAGMMQMFTNNSEDAIVADAFEIIPAGKKTGESWSDTVVTKETKTIRKYTLNSITGSEATIQLDITSNAANKFDFQGMELEIKTDTKTKGEIIADITTGIVKKRSGTSDITGSLPMMGQDMPISAKVTTSSIYK